jgi:exo-beta-1,3-glucanase (GH17 family)
MRKIEIILSAVLMALIAGLIWFIFNQPQAIPYDFHGKVKSVSFAPFHDGESPLKKIYPTPEEITQDISIISQLSQGVRTYSSQFGMEIVPKLAAEKGMTVTFSAWLGDDLTAKSIKNNQDEIESLIREAKAHPETISRVIVGNEVLLRHDLKPDQLISYIRQVKSAIPQPVSYADVWAFYLKYPEVVKELDYLTIHILPFWEDEPVSVDEAGQHIIDILHKIKEAFPGKPILIGETGWPSKGRNRGASKVNLVTEAHYIRMISSLAEKEGFDYNLIEGFDQPWKSALENTVGAGWGLLDRHRHIKFPFFGLVLERIDWLSRAILAISLGLVLGVWGALRAQSRESAHFILIISQIFSSLFWVLIYHLQEVTLQDWHYLWFPLRVIPPSLLALSAIVYLTLFHSQEKPTEKQNSLIKLALWLFIGEGLYGVIWSFLLFWDGRYRDIPVIDFSLPVVSFFMISLFCYGDRLFFKKGKPVTLTYSSQEFSIIQPFIPQKIGQFMSYALLIATFLSLASEARALSLGSDFLKDHPDLWERTQLLILAFFHNQEMLVWALMQGLWSLLFWRFQKNDLEALARAVTFTKN